MLESIAAVSGTLRRKRGFIDSVCFQAEIIFDVRIFFTDLLICSVENKRLHRAADLLRELLFTDTEADRVGFHAESLVKEYILCPALLLRL